MKFPYKVLCVGIEVNRALLSLYLDCKPTRAVNSLKPAALSKTSYFDDSMHCSRG